MIRPFFREKPPTAKKRDITTFMIRLRLDKMALAKVGAETGQMVRMTGVRLDEFVEHFITKRLRNCHDRQAHPQLHQRSRLLSETDAQDVRSRMPFALPHEDLVRIAAREFQGTSTPT